MMEDTILIVCPDCGKSVDTPRCDQDPNVAVEITGVLCGDCGEGTFDLPVYLDIQGKVVEVLHE